MTSSALSAQSGGSEFEPGRVIGGRFEVQGALEGDGFGQQFAALDRKTGRPVSLRVVRSAAIANVVRPHLKAAGELSHANVLPSFGLAQSEQGSTLIVQGPLLGKHLADYAAARRSGGKPVSLRGAYNVVAHVCNALTAIHATGPHGAVRPAAVWIGEDGRVQLADIVIARAALSAGGTGGLNENEAAFLAPEIKLGGAPRPASDIFGLGALLYVLLTGRNPNDAFIAPSEAHREASQGVDAELMRALSPDPTARHASPEAFRIALLAQISEGEQESRDDFGVDVEVEINLASVAPSRPSAARASMSASLSGLQVPKAPRMPNIPGVLQAGARVSLHDDFRVSITEDESEASAARARRSLGEVDLKDVLAKITEDDSPRWMLVKAGMDHGPFSGRQIVNMIVQGDALRDHDLMNTDTGNRGKIGEFPEFQDFLAQYELRRGEQARAVALQKSEKSEKHGAFFKVGIGIAVLALIGVVAGAYALSRSGARGGGRGGADAGDLYKRGALDISGSAGILPMPRGGRGGARRAGGGGAGGSMSYEDAMMQAVDIGSAAAGGEQTLGAQTVAGVMNRNLNQIFDACVKGSVGQVKIDIAIAGSGQVLGVSVNAGDAGFQSCVASQVRRVRFPAFSAPRMGARYSFGT